MRVIAGSAKGRKLMSPPPGGARPTSDKIREALFSAVAGRIPDAKVLDLYAGTGALGIEALSRGAAEATFVDNDAAAIKLIQANLASAGFLERGAVIKVDAAQFLKGRAPERPFDLVLMDPPYADGAPLGVIESLSDGFVGQGSLIVLECSSRSLPGSLPEGFWVRAQKRYGDSALLYLEPKETQQ